MHRREENNLCALLCSWRGAVKGTRIILILISLLLAGCVDGSFTEIQPKKARLIDGLNSYSRFSEIKRGLKLTNQNVRIIENSRESASDGTPFDFRVVEIEYSHLNYRGKLRLTFFNNRLMSAQFFPDKAHQYIARLEEKQNFKFDRKGQANEGDFTKLRVGKDVRGKTYVLWEDTRLKKDVRRWLQRYS